MGCYFCNSNQIAILEKNHSGKPISYDCPRCGPIYLSEEAVELYIPKRDFTEEKKKIISIVIRNEYERRRRKPSAKVLTFNYLDQILEQYRPLDPLDKMDNVLINLERSSEYTGSTIDLNP